MAADLGDFDNQFAGMSGDSLLNWLRTDGAAIFSSFDTGEAALDWFREQGGHVSTSNWYMVRRQVLDLELYSERLSGLDDSDLIPLAWTQSGTGLRLGADFCYRFKVEGFDADGNSLEDAWLSVDSARQLTLGQAKDMLYGFTDEWGLVSDCKITGLSLCEALGR